MESPILGALDRIAELRQRHGRLVGSIEQYEARVAEQAARLSRMNRREYGEEDEWDKEVVDEVPVAPPAEAPMTEEDLRREEEEVRELERKKRGLEDRVSALGKDITGVLR